MVSELDDVLQQFKGKTPDQIVNMIKRRGIKGRMGTTYGCPMALLLDGQNTGDFVVGRKYIVRRSGGTIQKARTPENVATVVRKFDIGDYPELVAPPPRCTANEGSPRKIRRNRDRRTERKRTIKQHLSKLVGRFHEE